MFALKNLKRSCRTILMVRDVDASPFISSLAFSFVEKRRDGLDRLIVFLLHVLLQFHIGVHVFPSLCMFQSLTI